MICDKHTNWLHRIVRLRSFSSGDGEFHTQMGQSVLLYGDFLIFRLRQKRTGNRVACGRHKRQPFRR
jgi:hypothetical protein